MALTELFKSLPEDVRKVSLAKLARLTGKPAKKKDVDLMTDLISKLKGDSDGITTSHE